jgi:hypothetical protein
MKFYRIIPYCILAAAFSVSSQPSSGEPQTDKIPMMQPMGPGMRGMHSSIENPQPMMMNMTELQNLMSEINIDKNVSIRITGIARSFLKLLDEKILKVQKEELGIKEELLKDKPDLQVIQNGITRKSQIFSEIEFAQIKRDLDIKSLLTQDEYDRWKSAMMTKMRKMMPAVMDKLPPNQQDKKGPPQR